MSQTGNNNLLEEVQQIVEAVDTVREVVQNAQQDEDLANLPTNILRGGASHTSQPHQNRPENSSDNSEIDDEAENNSNENDTENGDSDDGDDSENTGQNRRKREKTKQMPASQRVIMFISILCIGGMLYFWYTYHFKYSTPFYIEQRTWGDEVQAAADRMLNKDLSRDKYGRCAEVTLPYTVEFFNDIFYVDVLGERYTFDLGDYNVDDVIYNTHVRINVNYNIATLHIYYIQIEEFLTGETDTSQIEMEINPTEEPKNP